MRGLVAQWLEHTLDKRGVASSTLARPTTVLAEAQAGYWAMSCFRVAVESSLEMESGLRSLKA